MSEPNLNLSFYGWRPKYPDFGDVDTDFAKKREHTRQILIEGYRKYGDKTEEYITEHFGVKFDEQDVSHERLVFKIESYMAKIDPADWVFEFSEVL